MLLLSDRDFFLVIILKEKLPVQRGQLWMQILISAGPPTNLALPWASSPFQFLGKQEPPLEHLPGATVPAHPCAVSWNHSILRTAKDLQDP